ncbi:MAG: radical SAM protein, partial [Promethearchaeota archaeon]
MNSDPEHVINQIKEAGIGNSLEILDNLPASQFEALLSRLREITDKRFGRKVKFYIPGKKFPSISITGYHCDLKCKHCNTKYLHGMIPAASPELLEKQLFELFQSGANGALISGGSTKDGIVEMDDFYGVLKKVKDETNLKLNIHTGLLSLEHARMLKDSGVDAVSLDLVGDDETIKKIYGLDKTVEDYIVVLRNLISAGFTPDQIIPHICIGLLFGEIAGEYNVLEYL